MAETSHKINPNPRPTDQEIPPRQSKQSEPPPARKQPIMPDTGQPAGLADAFQWQSDMRDGHFK